MKAANSNTVRGVAGLNILDYFAIVVSRSLRLPASSRRGPRMGFDSNVEDEWRMNWGARVRQMIQRAFIGRNQLIKGVEEPRWRRDIGVEGD